MNILAIDTASEYLSLAIRINSKSCYILEKVGNLQSEFIIPKIQELLKQLLDDANANHGVKKVSLNDIDVIAYNQGPGSFTGVRIGLSVAIGIAIGLDIKLIPIPAFAILAHSSMKQIGLLQPNFKPSLIIVGIDARLNQLYLAGINPKTMEYHINPQVIYPQDVGEIVNTAEIQLNDIAVSGNGFTQHFSLLPENIKYLEYTEYPNALNLLELVDSGLYEAVSADDADVLYLRNKVALNLVEQQAMRGVTTS